MTPLNGRTFVDLISGQRRGPAASLLRAGLTILSFGYVACVLLRNAWYRIVPGAVKRAPRPVISIGNITAGGTGKTPLAAWLAIRLAERDLRVAILTRGYRAPLATGNAPSDEAALLARLCPKADVVVDPDRVAGAGRAVSLGADVLLLDDGFQHRRLRRDLDIVLIDATCAFGFGRWLPRGLLREPLWSLRRADVLVLTRCDLVDSEKRRRLSEALAQMSGGRPMLRCRHRIAGFADLKGRPVADVDVRAMQAVVFAGLGNFEPFAESVRRLGAGVSAAYQYPDHHEYSDAEMTELCEVAERLDANVLVTTEKDAVKLVGRWPAAAIPLLAARLELEFDPGDADSLMLAVGRTVSASGGKG